MEKWEVVETETKDLGFGNISIEKTIRGVFAREEDADQLINQLIESQNRYNNPMQISKFEKRKVKTNGNN